MKKLLVLISVLFLLTGCGNKVIYGEVQSITTKGDYVQLTFVGKEDTVLADGKTMVYSFSGIEGDLLSGDLIRPYITAYDVKRTFSGCYSDRIYVESAILPEPYVLTDGTQLTVRKDMTHTTYFAPNGIDILREEAPIGPANVHSGNVPSLDTLNTQAQKAITSYYEEQGLLYDLDSALEKAHQEFLSMGNPVDFYAHHLSQEIVPAAANETLIGFLTIVMQPIDGIHSQEYRRSTIFDRNTGEVIDITELFQCPPDQIPEALLSAAKLSDPNLAQSMANSLRLEDIHLQPDALELWFVDVSMSDLSDTHIVCVNYEDLKGILHPWAVPDSIE